MRAFLATVAAAALAATGAAADPGGKPDRNGERQQRASISERGPGAERREAPRPMARVAERREAPRPRPQTAPRQNLREARDLARPVAAGPVRSWPEERRRHFARGPIAGCPPGLAKKNNGCVPPGLARAVSDRAPAYYRPDWWGYRRFGEGRYVYDDGYLLRIGRGGSVDGYIPLLGGALSVGHVWPSYYEPLDLPPYYVNYYDLGPPGGYRYADHVIYRIDPRSAAITSIAALLTGNDFVVGQRVPVGYEVYNVPFAYRDRYVDGPGAYYRYSDGYVYAIDPGTLLIASAIELAL